MMVQYVDSIAPYSKMFSRGSVAPHPPMCRKSQAATTIQRIWRGHRLRCENFEKVSGDIVGALGISGCWKKCYIYIYTYVLHVVV